MFPRRYFDGRADDRVLLPTVERAGFDLLWFGIFVVLVVEMAQITPPVGFNLFVLQGMTKKGRFPGCPGRLSPCSYSLMVVMVLLMYFVPGITSWLPQHMAN